MLKPTIINGEWRYLPPPPQDAAWLSRHPELTKPQDKAPTDRKENDMADAFENWRRALAGEKQPIYEVNPAGQVRNAETGFIRKLTPNHQGYLKLRVRHKAYFVHRLVAIAFIPNPLNLPQVNHIDGDKTNNAVSNLEWCTPRQNSDHAVKSGLLNPAFGERNAAAKLTEDQVREIRAAYLPGVRQKDIAAQFGVCQRTICMITRREGWAHVE